MAQLIVIRGTSGTGKTTLAKRLGRDTRLPVMHKDVIKELLYDEVGLGDSQWKKLLGLTSAHMMFTFVKEMAQADQSVIIESTILTPFAAEDVRELVQQTNVSCLELVCVTDEAARLQRCRDRIERGDRHPGHVEQDQLFLDDKYATALNLPLAELGIGPQIVVDTTNFDEQAYRQLLSAVNNFLAGADNSNA